MTRRRKWHNKKAYKRKLYLASPQGAMENWLIQEMYKMINDELERVVIGNWQYATPENIIQNIADAKKRMEESNDV